MIHGVKIKKLRPYVDERGKLVVLLTREDALFTKFGQVYITTVNPGHAKAWHCHRQQTDNLACIVGIARLAIYDDRKGSPTHGQVAEFLIGENNPCLVQVPPGIYHGFESATRNQAVVINIPDRVYCEKKPDEFRLPFNTDKIPFKWHASKGG